MVPLLAIISPEKLPEAAYSSPEKVPPAASRLPFSHKSPSPSTQNT